MKPCPFCAEQIQDAAVKCRFCNSMLNEAPAAAKALAAKPAASVDVHDARNIHVLFDGPPSWRATLGAHLLAMAMVLAGAALAMYLGFVMSGAEASYAIGGAVLFVVGAGWLFWLRVVRRSRRVRITTQTIDIESGIFGRTIQTLQLWRVRDIEFEQTFAERILGLARIRVLSHDADEPTVVLAGLPAGRKLFLDLRDAIAIARQSRNVVGLID